jgi:signal transduction histidine kinase
MADPTSSLKAAYPEGTIHRCVVKKVEPFGAIVHLEQDPSVRGFIHRHDWSWTRRLFDLSQKVRPGETHPGKVVGYRRGELRLSRREALPDPYGDFRKHHGDGDPVVCEVKLLVQKGAGVLVSVEGGVDGFIPRSELPGWARDQDGFGLLAEDHLAARILRFEKGGPVLSVREHLRALEKNEDAGGSLRYHPTLGVALEDAFWDLELQKLAEPRVDAAVRRRIRRVLVVEDHEDVSGSLETVFEHFGFVCDRAGSLSQGRNCLADESYDLLILDLDLAGSNGAELLRDLDPERILVYVLTASDEEDGLELLGDEAGRVRRFFRKPTPIREILGQLNQEPESVDHLIPSKEPGFSQEGDAAAPTSASWGLQPLETSRRVKIEENLAHLLRDTGADRAFVLAFQPGPLFTLVAGRFPELTREVQQNLEISEVGNVIRERSFVFVPEVAKKPKKGQAFEHLLPFLPCGSFAGVALDYRDQADYGLFVTGREAGQLHGVTESRMRTAALQIGTHLAEERLDQVLAEKQSLLLAGLLADSLLHELKNEVQALDGHAAFPLLLIKKHQKDLRSMEAKEVAGLKEAVVGIQQVSGHLRDLVLLFHHIAARPHQEKVGLNDTVLRLQKTLQPLAHKQQVHLDSDLGKGIPPLYLNPKLLDQPMLNLLINGIEQMVLAGVQRRTLRIATRYLPEEDYPVRITISDSGGGIPRVHWEKIFELFFTTKPEGTGLGLYISRFFIDRLGGRVRLMESLRFTGTTFRIELPRTIVA